MSPPTAYCLPLTADCRLLTACLQLRTCHYKLDCLTYYCLLLRTTAYYCLLLLNLLRLLTTAYDCLLHPRLARAREGGGNVLGRAELNETEAGRLRAVVERHLQEGEGGGEG